MRKEWEQYIDEIARETIELNKLKKMAQDREQFRKWINTRLRKVNDGSRAEEEVLSFAVSNSSESTYFLGRKSSEYNSELSKTCLIIIWGQQPFNMDHILPNSLC